MIRFGGVLAVVWVVGGVLSTGACSTSGSPDPAAGGEDDGGADGTPRRTNMRLEDGGGASDGTAPDTNMVWDTPGDLPPLDAQEPAALFEAACTNYGVNACERLTFCEPFIVRFLLGGSCAARFKLYCLLQATAPDSRMTPSQLSSCANRISTTSCSEVVNGGPLDACFPPGNRTNGQPCGARSSCLSGYCRRAEGGCGVCRPRAAAGEPCESDAHCDDALLCNDDGICVTAGHQGNACSEGLPCRAELSCFRGTCVRSAQAGALCFEDECDILQGLWCSGATPTRAGVCQTIHVGAPGDRCGLVGSNFVVCGGSGKCDDTLATCIGPALEGEGCGANGGGRACFYPAECVDQRICRLYDARICR